ncbi:MAG: hypothetical protein IKV87_04185 [Methanobrevibacter sp.]|nr:hypothetical protein [Methanobrevibacter sp.]
MYIRKAIHEDLSVIMSIYQLAQDFMIASGNHSQWGRSYPSEELIIDDIDNEACHLICDDEDIHGVFALFDSDEPSYQYIEDGQWLNDEPYLTVHRIASDGKVHGIFNCAISYCKSKSENIRIDTHKDNLIMQKQIERNGFQKCGIIYVRDKSPRIAYQWTKY